MSAPHDSRATLRDFTRVSWASIEAQAAWRPRVAAISRRWSETEVESVACGVRPACLTRIALSRQDEWRSRCRKLGLSYVPLCSEQASPWSYSAAAETRGSAPYTEVRAVIGTSSSALAFLDAWRARSHDAMGALLGYPSCCRAFFEDEWIRRSSVDTTWAMAMRTAGVDAGADEVTVASGEWRANVLWRWLGVRAVPHLPCRFDCAATAALAERLLDVTRASGDHRVVDWLRELLRWPVEWTALHGIAEIKTPILRVAARTDVTARKRTVRWEGDAAPAGRSAVRPVACVNAPRWLYADNGFSSFTAMEDLHRPVVEAARAALAGRGGRVLDLGCGNGWLLRKICSGDPRLVPFGVERDAAKARHAMAVLPGRGQNVSTGDFVRDPAWTRSGPYRLAILMAGRLVEADPPSRTRLIAALRSCAESVLLYTYPDWSRHGFADLGAWLGSPPMIVGERISIVRW